eukprot:1195816-Prorocentrum_minimum.AAC.15
MFPSSLYSVLPALAEGAMRRASRDVRVFVHVQPLVGLVRPMVPRTPRLSRHIRRSCGSVTPASTRPHSVAQERSGRRRVVTGHVTGDSEPETMSAPEKNTRPLNTTT